MNGNSVVTSVERKLSKTWGNKYSVEISEPPCSTSGIGSGSNGRASITITVPDMLTRCLDESVSGPVPKPEERTEQQMREQEYRYKLENDLLDMPVTHVGDGGALHWAHLEHYDIPENGDDRTGSFDWLKAGGALRCDYYRSYQSSRFVPGWQSIRSHLALDEAEYPSGSVLGEIRDWVQTFLSNNGTGEDPDPKPGLAWPKLASMTVTAYANQWHYFGNRPYQEISLDPDNPDRISVQVAYKIYRDPEVTASNQSDAQHYLSQLG